MERQNYFFWSCPDCVHVRELDLERSTNRCRLIDQGESPVDGRAWEDQDHDLCPAFKVKADREAPVLITGLHSSVHR